MSVGKVYLVGAGPGDPGLLTIKAVQVLAQADVVVYDHLVADAILDRLPDRAERIYAGKEAGAHTMNQDLINALLEERARRGQLIVRLKGGDPFLFGRGGEEAEYLSERGVAFEVVPGVTSALGVPAYAGIPVTHRTLAASVAVVTARAGPNGDLPRIDWDRLAGADTLVILMGVASLERVVGILVANGRSGTTPVAAIRWGTTAQQRTVVGTLETIEARVRAADLRPPAILVVGPVVSMMERVRWADRRPLFGRRVLLPTAHPSPLTEPLERFGAEVLHVSPVEIEPPASWRELDRAIRDLGTWRGIIFADDVGVATFFARLAIRGGDARLLARHRVIADGHETATALGHRSIRADRVIDDWNGEATAELVMGPWLVVGRPEAQAVIAAALRARGGQGDAPGVCRCSVSKWRADRLRELLTTRPIHAVAFTQRSEVRALMAALDLEERRLLRGVHLASFGESTAQALRDHGFEPSIVARDASASGLADTLAGVLAVVSSVGSA